MNKKLSGINMVSFVISGMMGIELIIMPRLAVAYAKTDAWMCPLIVGGITVSVAYASFWICDQYPDLKYVEIMEKVSGKILGKISLAMIVGYNIFISGITLRMFAESISIFLLENTPLWLIMVLFIMTIFYCIKRDMKSISIVLDMLLPFVIFFIAVLLLLSLTAVEIKNILPIFADGIMPVIKGALNIISPASGAYVFVMILPYFNNTEETKKYVIGSIIFSVIIYSIIVMLCIMTLGDTEILFLTFPTLTLSKTIQMEFQIFERADSLFMTAWIPITLLTIITYYLIANNCAKQMFNTEKNNIISVVQILIIFIIAVIPQNIGQLMELLKLANASNVFLVFIYFPIFTLAVFIKKRGGKNKAKQT